MVDKKKEELATTGSAEMVRPDFIKAGGKGTEHISNADMQIPRLLLAQKMSPEVDEGDAKRIENLKVGDIFNGLTHEIYGRGPLKFVILRADPPRWVEFIPRSEGGGVKDPNVKFNDPRTQWSADGGKPKATKFYDYVILMLPLGEDPLARMVALSFKSTGIKIARQLNALIKLRNADIFAGVYVLSSVDTQNSLGKFATFNIANGGFVMDEALYHQLEQLSDSLKDKKIDIERGDEGDGDDSFVDPDAPDAEKEPAVTGM